MDDIQVELDQIWKTDVLGRCEDAKYLGDYLVKRFLLKPTEPGFVLAVDGEWGYGKSFMIKRWQQEFALQNYPTVFFDAWQNDYTGDPLLAFIAELDSGLEEFFNKMPTISGVKAEFIDTVKKTWKPLVKALAFAASKKAIGFGAQELHDALNSEDVVDNEEQTKDPKEDFKEIPKKMQEAIDKALSEHKTTKNAIAGFKRKLAALIGVLQAESNIQLPLFIFVDELDRCRPDYAIELLEGIKHLFGVPGVYFVVATNTVQLGESIKAVYGSGFDGQRYLKRFFDLQYTLPEPSNEQFARALFAEMQLPNISEFEHGLEYLEGVNFEINKDGANIDLLVLVLSVHTNAFGIGLRDQKQIVNMLEAAFINLKGQKIHIFFLMFLAFTYHQDLAAFNSIAKSGIKSEVIFENVRTAGRAGTINYVYDPGGPEQRQERRVNVMDIASIYFNNLEIPEKEISRVAGSAGDFPRVLMRGVKCDRSGRIFRPQFCNYFDVVRHAGGFNRR